MKLFFLLLFTVPSFTFANSIVDKSLLDALAKLDTQAKTCPIGYEVKIKKIPKVMRFGGHTMVECIGLKGKIAKLVYNVKLGEPDYDKRFFVFIKNINQLKLRIM